MPHYSDYGGTSYSDVGENSEERDLELGENIYLRENSIYTIVDGPSWTEAEANANKLGGHLASINDKDEDKFVWNNIGTTASLKGGEHNEYESNHQLTHFITLHH